MAFVNYNFSLFNRQSLFFVTLCYDFSAFCAFFDSLNKQSVKIKTDFAFLLTINEFSYIFIAQI